MVSTLTADAFRPHLGSDFQAHDGSHSELVLRLAEVELLGQRPGAPRAEPFSLIFVGPSTPILEQRTYRIEHDELGVLEIFLVPIGAEPDGGIRYEAVFN